MTRFRCDGIFNDSFIANFKEIVKVQKNENRLVYDEVMPKILLVPFFPGHGVVFRDIRFIPKFLINGV